MSVWFHIQEFPEPHHYSSVAPTIAGKLMCSAWGSVSSDGTQLKWGRGEDLWSAESLGPTIFSPVHPFFFWFMAFAVIVLFLVFSRVGQGMHWGLKSHQKYFTAWEVVCDIYLNKPATMPLSLFIFISILKGKRKMNRAIYPYRRHSASLIVMTASIRFGSHQTDCRGHSKILYAFSKFRGSLFFWGRK